MDDRSTDDLIQDYHKLRQTITDAFCNGTLEKRAVAEWLDLEQGILNELRSRGVTNPYAVREPTREVDP